MPPRRVSKTVKLSQTLAQFGELETTPTSRQFGLAVEESNPPTSFQPLNTNPLDLQEDPAGSLDEFEDGVDDLDLIKLPDLSTRPVQNPAIPWSDIGPETRENSPELTAQTPRNLWNFEEDDTPAPLSDSISKDLPETNQLSLDRQPDLHLEPQRQIDFSETASISGRSSPVTYILTRELQDECALDSLATRHVDSTIVYKTQKIAARSPEQHLSADEMYNATPIKAALHGKVAAKAKPRAANPAMEQITTSKGQAANPSRASKKRSMGEMIQSDLQSEKEENPRSRKNAPRRNVKPVSVQTAVERVKQSTKPSEPTPSKDQRSNQKAKRSRQRAKSPLRFDEAAREFRDITQTDKPRPSPRMPIVSALREAAQLSSSPAVNAKKTSAPKANPPKMQREVPSPKEQSKKPGKPYTRAAAKKDSGEPPRESNLGLKHVTRQVRAGAARNIESTRSPIIEIHSDTPSSSEPDSCLSPPNHPGTADTMTDHPVREANKPVSRIVRFLPEKEFDIAHRPKRPPKVEVLDEEDLYIPSDHSGELCEPNRQSAQKRKKGQKPEDSVNTKKQKKTHHAAENIAKRQVLGARDPNAQVQEFQKHKKGTHQEPQDGASQTRVVPSEQVTRCKAVRNWSISVAGSPVPMNNDSVPQSRSDGSSSSAQADETISRKLNYGLLNSRGGKIHPSPGLDDGSAATCDTRRPAQQMLGNIVDSRNNKPISAPARGARKQRSPPQTILPGSASTNKDMHRQIVAAFELQDANREQGEPADQEPLQVNKETVSRTTPQEIRDDVAVQLHSIVDIMTKYLQSKEATAYNAVDGYHKSGLKCVKKIDTGFSRYKQSLDAECKRDCAQFMKHLDAATRSVQKGQERRQAVENKMADDLILRHELYCKATRTLRAFHERLLGQGEMN